MNKVSRYQFFALIIILFGILSYKTYEQYVNMQNTNKLIILNESESIATFINSFRQVYQDVFVENEIEVTEQTMRLLPVQTMAKISDKFSSGLHREIVVKTVSDKPRNHNNMANDFELKMIEYFKNNPIKESAFVQTKNNEYIYTVPLYIKQSCLTCHGKREEVIPSIRDKYSTAYDYKIGDIRGILSIEIKNRDTLKHLYNDFIINTFLTIIIFLVSTIFIYFLIKKISLNEYKYTKALKKEVEVKTKEIQKYTTELESKNKNLDKLIKQEVKKNEKHQETLFKQSRMAQMGEMISMIAHQWRQPLGAISATSIDLNMKMELGIYDTTTQEGRDEAQKYFCESLKQIDELVHGLTVTIDDFRNFYKPDKAQERSLINVPVKKAMAIFETSLKSDNISFSQNYESKNIVSIYSNELMQVILNILQNAQDNFLEKDMADAKISIKTFDIEDNSIIEIYDNGGGVSSKFIEKIFDPYFSTKNEKNGTGIGLYMSKIIIEEHHNGELSVENIDDGVCFKIKLMDKGVSDDN